MSDTSSSTDVFSLSASSVSSCTSTSSSAQSAPWCTVAYWELRERVGRLFPVADNSLHVFQQLPRGDGMCLGLLQQPSAQDGVRRTREKIGFGVILSREAAHAQNDNVERLRALRELEAELERERERKKRRAKMKARARDKGKASYDEVDTNISSSAVVSHEAPPVFELSPSGESVDLLSPRQSQMPHGIGPRVASGKFLGPADSNQDVIMGVESQGGLDTLPSRDSLLLNSQRLCSSLSSPSSSLPSSSTSTSSPSLPSTSSSSSVSPSYPPASPLFSAFENCLCVRAVSSSSLSLSAEVTDRTSCCGGCRYSADDNGYWTLCPSDGAHAGQRQRQLLNSLETHHLHHHHHHHQHHHHHESHNHRDQHCTGDGDKAPCSLAPPSLRTTITTTTTTTATRTPALSTAISTTSGSAHSVETSTSFSSPESICSSSSSSSPPGHVYRLAAGLTEQTGDTLNANSLSCGLLVNNCPERTSNSTSTRADTSMSLSEADSKSRGVSYSGNGSDGSFTCQNDHGRRQCDRSCDRHENHIDSDCHMTSFNGAMPGQKTCQGENVGQRRINSRAPSNSKHHPNPGCEYRSPRDRECGCTARPCAVTCRPISHACCLRNAHSGKDSPVNETPPGNIHQCDQTTNKTCSLNLPETPDSQMEEELMDFVQSIPLSEEHGLKNQPHNSCLHPFQHHPHCHPCPRPEISSPSASAGVSPLSSQSLNQTSSSSSCFHSPQPAHHPPPPHIAVSSTSISTPTLCCSSTCMFARPPGTAPSAHARSNLSVSSTDSVFTSSPTTPYQPPQGNFTTKPCDTEADSTRESGASPGDGSPTNLSLPSSGGRHDPCYQNGHSHQKMSFTQTPVFRSTPNMPPNSEGCDVPVQNYYTPPSSGFQEAISSSQKTSTPQSNKSCATSVARTNSLCTVGHDSFPNHQQQTYSKGTITTRNKQPQQPQLQHTGADTTTNMSSMDHQQQHHQQRTVVNDTTTTSVNSGRQVLQQGQNEQEGEVWAYNASEFPIFVNSPTLDDPDSPRSLVVKKVPPGCSIKIFDYARAELLERTEARNVLLTEGPFDDRSVRISMAKGWGPSYARQIITSCPCWLEVLLGPRADSHGWINSSAGTGSDTSTGQHRNV